MGTFGQTEGNAPVAGPLGTAHAHLRRETATLCVRARDGGVLQRTRQLELHDGSGERGRALPRVSHRRHAAGRGVLVLRRGLQHARLAVRQRAGRAWAKRSGDAEHAVTREQVYAYQPRAWNMHTRPSP